MSRWVLATALCLVAACSSPKVAYLTDDIPEDASLHPVFIAKSGFSQQGAGLFVSGREPGMSYARAVVSIPAVHQPGDVLWPRLYPPTPDRHFVLSEVRDLDNAQDFRAAIAPSADGERIVLVHGYNMTPSETVFSAAQISKDFALKEPIVAFSWPSAGRTRGYLHDRDSVLFARSDLSDTLKLLTQNPSERVSLVGHSMGAALVMETLRELALRNEVGTLARISSVILVAPDLDPEVFRRQARDIGTLPQPFVIFVAANDRALRFASLFSFQQRLGAIRNLEDIRDLDVTLIDVSSLSDGESFNHEIALTSPAAIRLLRGVREGDPDAQQALQQYLVTGAPPILPD